MSTLLLLLLLLLWGLAAADDGGESRFAVCVTGQLRAGALPEVQERLFEAVVRPLGAEVFVVVSREHTLGHVDFNIPRNGCYTDPRKCAPRDGQENETWLREVAGRPPIDVARKWPKGKPAERAPSTDEDLERLRAGPLAPRFLRVMDDDETLRSATEAFGDAHPSLFQRALRARNRWCLADVEARERRRQKPFDYVVRVRPDYVFACALPPATFWPSPDTPWAATAMDFFEVMDRETANSNLGLWSRPEPPAPCVSGIRVESCAFYAMCGAGANVTAVDHVDRRLRDDAGPRLPGEIARPCCDPTSFLPRALTKPLDTSVWCPLHRHPYLHGWWYDHSKRSLRDLALDAANALLGPRCVKNKAPVPRQEEGGDDDDDDQGADNDPLDDEVLAILHPGPEEPHSWIHEWAAGDRRASADSELR
ncbi:hypothetical protein CTAYLR_001413 [Chrysophaeum taylorii]|uniref:Uncharacterized protein n=1 Tax=Chrysophaeum taylorii TaxID=2483200 RepID=A0AAD7U8T8_9STRA|nr:hypothetical protein CTAYLR_001413 [Chrysophaeum taylorii]